jgi:hypothetical protein
VAKSLPDDASFDEIMEEFHFKTKVSKACGSLMPGKESPMLRLRSGLARKP